MKNLTKNTIVCTGLIFGSVIGYSNTGEQKQTREFSTNSNREIKVEPNHIDRPNIQKEQIMREMFNRMQNKEKMEMSTETEWTTKG